MTYGENLWLFSTLLFGIIILPGIDMLFVPANAIDSLARYGTAATGGMMLVGWSTRFWASVCWQSSSLSYSRR